MTATTTATTSRKPKAKVSAPFADAPPCIRAVIDAGCPGKEEHAFYRMAALFLVRKYDRKHAERHLKNLRDRLGSDYMNDGALEGIFKKEIFGRWGRKEYRCHEQPCKALCDRAACTALAFGLGSRDDDQMHDFGPFTKIAYEPEAWFQFTVNGHPVLMSASDLCRQNLFAAAVVAASGRTWVRLKETHFIEFIGAQMEGCKVVQPLDDTQPWSVLSAALGKWIRNEIGKQRPPDEHFRFAVLERNPGYQGGGFDRVVFRFIDFYEFLMKHAGKHMTPDQRRVMEQKHLVWDFMHKAGAEVVKVRIAEGDTRDLWAVPAEQDLVTDAGREASRAGRGCGVKPSPRVIACPSEHCPDCGNCLL